MEHRDWTLLSLISQDKSISQISEELYISQPALSYRLKRIESFFNTELFIRTNKGLQTTPQGERVINLANQYLERMEELNEDILSLSDTPKGPLRIGASNAIAQFHLPKLLSKFHSLYTEIDLNLTTGFSDQLMKLLTENKIHVAFLRENIEWASYKKKLDSDDIYLVSKHPIQIDELPYISRVTYKTNLSLANLISNWWTQHFKLPPKVTMEVDNAEACTAIIRAGLGYAILPGLTLGDTNDLYMKELYTKDNEKLTRGVWMYTSQRAQDYITANTFVQYILDQY
jgi:DNA-binding transcriptional LysR family regulator